MLIVLMGVHRTGLIMIANNYLLYYSQVLFEPCNVISVSLSTPIIVQILSNKPKYSLYIFIIIVVSKICFDLICENTIDMVLVEKSTGP